MNVDVIDNMSDFIKKSDLIMIRSYRPNDEAFIYATWLRDLYSSDSWYSHIKKTVFMTHYHRVIELILKNNANFVKIACLKDDPDTILGYGVFNLEETIIHYIFIKKAWRKIGIGKMLITPRLKVTTHLTKTGQYFMKKLKIDFNPFLI